MIVNLANPKTKKTYSIKTEGPVYIGKRLNDSIDLSVLKLKGKGLITGGSTKDGFPMVPFVSGAVQKQVLLSKGTAFKPLHKGERRRKTVFGDIINEKIEQVNIKILELEGDFNLDEMFPKQEKKK